MALAKLARAGLATQAGLLAAVVGLVAAPTALVAYSIWGAPGVSAAIAAAMVCLAGGELALAIGAALGRHLGPLHAVLVGMLVRMALPLLLALGLHFAMPALTPAGFFFFLLIFYPIVLATETILAVAHLPHQTPSNRAI